MPRKKSDPSPPPHPGGQSAPVEPALSTPFSALTDSPAIATAFVFLVALVVRCLYLLDMRDSVLFSILLGDSAGYDRWARTIAEGNWIGSEVFYQAPLYPYFLAVVYAFISPSTWAVRIIQALFGAGAAALLGYAGRLWFGPLAGLIAGLLLALYPPAIFFDGLLQKSVLDSLWMAALLALLPLYAGRRSIWLAGLLGVVLALFALTRENALALMPFVAGWMVVVSKRSGGADEGARSTMEPEAAHKEKEDRLESRSQNLGRRYMGLVGLTAGLLLVLLPVGIRNAAIGGRFLLTTSQFGPNFYIGNNPQADGFYQPLRKWRAEVKFEQRDARELAEAAAGRPLTPAEVSRHWAGRSWDYIRSQPLAWMKLTLRKGLMTWNASENVDTEALEAYRDESWLLYLSTPLLHFGILAPLGAIGLALTIHQWRRLWILYALLFVLSATVALFFVFARYRYPLVHPLMLFAAAALVALIASSRWKTWRGLGVPAAIGLIVALLVNVPNFAQMDPRALTYTNVAGALVDQRRHEEAQRFFDRAFAAYPDLPELHYAYGEALKKQDRHAEALNFLQKTLSAHPDLPDAHVLRAEVYAALGQCDAALADCAAALRLAANGADTRARCVEALLVAGNTLAQRGEFSDAQRCYREVIQLEPKRASAMNNLGLVLAQRGALDEAERWFTAALAAAPDLADAHNNLGHIWKARGDMEKARSAFERALQLDPQHGQARQNLEQLSR